MKLDEIINNTHNTFGGYIYPSDFNTETGRHANNSISWADRIASDLKYDEQCKRNCESRKINNKEEIYA